MIMVPVIIAVRSFDKFQYLQGYQDSSLYIIIILYSAVLCFKAIHKVMVLQNHHQPIKDNQIIKRTSRSRYHIRIFNSIQSHSNVCIKYAIISSFNYPFSHKQQTFIQQYGHYLLVYLIFFILALSSPANKGWSGYKRLNRC